MGAPPRRRAPLTLNVPASARGDRHSAGTRLLPVATPGRATFGCSLADDAVAEEQVSLILVVRAAAELNVVRGAYPSRCVRRDVMELEERGLAAPTYPSNKSAASLVALPHGTLHGRRQKTPRARTLARGEPR